MEKEDTKALINLAFWTVGIATGAAAAVFVLGGLRFIAESAGAGVHDRAARLLIDHHQRLAQSEKVHDAPDTHDP